MKYKELRTLLKLSKKECKDLKYELGNLLAIIHRDGGHYTAKHGIKKSCADAKTWVYTQRMSILEAEENEVDCFVERNNKY
jgi:hypothetical protein